MQRQDLERMTREQLIAQAERLGIPRPRVLTQPELIDEIIGRTSKNDRERTKARGWLGRARDLLARVVERGLHLPEAARVLRKDGEDKTWPAPPPPLPTVTLAEIYAAQGHLERAIAVLDQVIVREPDHRDAKAMRARFLEQAHRSRSRVGDLSAHATGSLKAPGPAVREKDPAPKQEISPSPGDAIPPTTKAPSARPASPMPSVTSPPAHPDPPPPPAQQAVVIEAAPTSKREEPTVVKDAHATDADVADATPPTAASATIELMPAASAHEDEPPGTELAADVAATAPPEPALLASPAPVAEPLEPEVLEAEALETEPLDLKPAPTAGQLPTAPAPAVVAADPLVSLDEPPLPDRYEVDEVVAIAVDPRTIYLYWEVRPTTLAHVRAQHPDGGLCIRVATVIATWEGPVVDTRDLLVDALYGDRFLRDIQPGSNVRVSVGWRSGDGFSPIAVGSEVSAPRAVPVEPIAQDVARWEAEPVQARFQSRRVESVSFAPPPRPPAYAPRLEPTAGVVAAFVERAEAASHHGGPVDTGVALWGGPVEAAAHDDDAGADAWSAPYEEELDEEPPVAEDAPGWFEPGGSSELGRGGPGRRMRSARGRRVVPGVPGRPFVPGAPPLAAAAPRGAPFESARLGGASELSPGGASELSF